MIDNVTNKNFLNVIIVQTTCNVLHQIHGYRNYACKGQSVLLDNHPKLKITAIRQRRGYQKRIYTYKYILSSSVLIFSHPEHLMYMMAI